MKSVRSILLLPGALLTGCATQPRTVTTTVTPSPAVAYIEADSVPPLNAQRFTRPALTKAYYVGPLVDPEHPELMYGGGVVVRRERPETWDMTGRAPQAVGPFSGPITQLPNGSEYGSLTEADREIQDARTDEIFAALLQQNAELAAKLSALSQRAPEQPSVSSAPPTITVPKGSVPVAGSVPANTAVTVSAPPLPVSPASIPAALERVDVPTVTLAPSADDVIELSPALLDPPIPGVTNPWRQRYQFKTVMTETKIRIDGISLGDDPTCIIGEKLFSVGDRFAVFTVASIDDEGIFLRRDSFLLRIPMQDNPITLRYP